MAGGFSKRGGGIPLGERSRGPIERLHGTVNRPPTAQAGPDRVTYGETAAYHDISAGPCHVWVTTEAGRHPGLLTEWRKPKQLPYEGHVHHGRVVDGRWALVDQWFPAGAIERA